MAALKAEGIILRKYLLRETSYILVVFTKEFGKVQGVIKGARNPYPQFAGDFEIFTQCQMLFYKKKKNPLDLITQCGALESFLPIRRDIERLTYASYFIELVNAVTDFYDRNEDLYNVLVESLRMMGQKASAMRVARIFELKLLGALGLTPHLKGCMKCGLPIENKAFFNLEKGGIVCAACGSPGRNSLPVSLGTLNFMRKIQTSELNKTARVKVSKEVGKESELVLKGFMQYHVNKPIRSLRFLGDLERVRSGQ
ncbi:MAG: DNA repair protein RecO [Candidatus Omnitrophica bacterium]|nr:DNA repair protein RecO [Candidatus Omnitrophota bacterium]